MPGPDRWTPLGKSAVRAFGCWLLVIGCPQKSRVLRLGQPRSMRL
jgi:hypothetical protein